MNPSILRSFYGGAAKFLIPRPRWSQPHPITRADNHVIVQAFHEGFDSWNIASLSDPHMRPTLDRLRAAASFTEGEHLRFKSAARRLGVLRYHMNVRLRKFIKNEKRPERGTNLYRLLMKRTWKGWPELDAETKDL